MQQPQVDLAIALVVALTLSCVFICPYLAITGWARERRREREALYRYDVLRKLAEHPACAAQVLAAIEGHAAQEAVTRRRSTEASGVAVFVAGAALTAALVMLPVGDAWLLGIVPAAVGATLVLYSRSPRPAAR